MKSKYLLDLPSDVPVKNKLSNEIIEALGLNDGCVYKGRDYYLVKLSDETEVKIAQPDFNRLKKLINNGIIISSEGTDVDFVSRFFAPAMGIDEDFVTGSAHCVLVPFWSHQLNKNKLFARQISSRGGNLECRLRKDRIELLGDVYIETEKYKNI